jgi:glycosyltransferase involved in cell wall biosynthesis
MPVYNAERDVAKAVQSILDQTYRDFEFLIVDDGSTDGSFEILKRYAKQDDRIRLISRPNSGIVGALNDGLAMARGQYIARMDGDDIALPHRFVQQLKMMEQNPKLVAVGSSWRPLDAAAHLGKSHPVIEKPEAIERALLLGNGIALLHPTVLMLRDAVEKIGGYRLHASKQHEDLDLYLRLSTVGLLGNSRKVLLYWRKHESSITAQAARSRQAFLDVEDILCQAHQERGTNLPVDWEYHPQRWSPLQSNLLAGWRSLKNRERIMAIQHGFNAIMFGPLRTESWRLLACAIRGF